VVPGEVPVVVLGVVNPTTVHCNKALRSSLMPTLNISESLELEYRVLITETDETLFKMQLD